VKEAFGEILPRIKRLKKFQYYTYKNAEKGDRFWVDEFRIGR